MNLRALRYLLLLVASAGALAAPPLPVLKPSDVVFMYQAPPEIYQAYGATVLAWGGTPNPKSLEEAAGLKFFGSVGMVTEFARYYERFPEKYESGLCRDLQGKPYQVPWLTDHRHKGVPFWWCCTRQPLFRQYISERVVQTVKAGAYGVHIDDHLGTAGSLFVGGGCFCDRCVAEFRDELTRHPVPEVKEIANYDYAREMRAWLEEQPGRRVEGHPLWPKWRVYQLRGAAAFVAELRELAATAGKEIPMSANAGLLWGPHLNDFTTLDFFSAEIDHHAGSKRFSDAPVAAYRIADAVNRPLASTASGGDWAFIKEQDRPGLVRGWIALGYAGGHSLMAPNRQWCYTKEKGTHWYEGPREKFAPLYRFVHEQPELFDGYRAYADVTVAYSQRTYDRNAGRLLDLCGKLSAANVAYDLALGGDEVVRHRLPAEQLRRARRVLVLEPQDFASGDQAALGVIAAEQRIASVEEVIAKAARCVQTQGENLRLLPRVKTGSAVIHVLNWAYDFTTDQVQIRKAVELKLDLQALGVRGAKQAEWLVPGAEPLKLPLENSTVIIPELDLWGVLRVQRP